MADRAVASSCSRRFHQAVPGFRGLGVLGFRGLVVLGFGVKGLQHILRMCTLATLGLQWELWNNT